MTIKTRHFIIFHIDNGESGWRWCREECGKERERAGKPGEDNENNAHGVGNGGGEEGEGLTAINFAKIGAYPVVGRQSNPGSARHPRLRGWLSTLNPLHVATFLYSGR